MELKSSELLQLIQVCNEQNVDSISIGDIKLSFKDKTRPKQPPVSSLPPQLAQIAQEAANFDNWSAELPVELKAQIAALPVDDK